MTPAAEILMFNGINPPPPGKDRTTCPVCSPHRRKSHRRCLSVHIGAALVSWRCHHCDYFRIGGDAMTRKIITAEAFTKATGRAPDDDDLERVNCPYAGQAGHWGCGWDDFQNLPAFETGCNIPAKNGEMQ